MSYQGVNFANQHIVPSDDGRLYQAIFDDGALSGCKLSYSGTDLTLAPGYLMVAGREIYVDAAEVFSCSAQTYGFAQLVLTIDLTQSATAAAFNQVSASIRYASTQGGFASLIQGDINGSDVLYECQLALVALSSGGIAEILEDLPVAQLKGGGGLSANAAVLHVTAPLGSTVTITKGTVSKSQGPEKSHANAEDGAIADYYFGIPADGYGTWTVTATMENRAASSTVAIGTNQQYDVALVFEIVLYADGTLNSAYSTSELKTPTNATITYEPEYVEMVTVGNKASDVFLRWDSIDLTSYKTLKATIATKGNNNVNANRIAAVFVSQDDSVKKFSAASVKADHDAYNDGVAGNEFASCTLELNIEECKGIWHVAVGTHTNDQGWNIARTARVFSVRLEG